MVRELGAHLSLHPRSHLQNVFPKFILNIYEYQKANSKWTNHDIKIKIRKNQSL